jgi:hypothetical protein
LSNPAQDKFFFKSAKRAESMRMVNLVSGPFWVGTLAVAAAHVSAVFAAAPRQPSVFLPAQIHEANTGRGAIKRFDRTLALENGENQMTHFSRKLTIGATLALSLLAGSTLSASAAGETVAFLMPDQGSTRYEEHDAPGFIAEMAKLCADCKVIYQNADADVAKQQQQFNAAITQGAKVIVLDPVDSTAAASLVGLAQSQGVKVIAYDRPIPTGKADFYVSFDNQGIGKAIADSLVAHLKASGVAAGGDTGVLQINGSPTDAAAGLIKKGIHEGLDASGYPILAEFDTRIGLRRKHRNGLPVRLRVSAPRSSALWLPMTAPAAAPLLPSRQPA